MHHPFTAPMDECLYYLETDKANVRAKAYDLVLNGVELSSGSIRITDPTLQNRIFSLLGLSEEEAKAKNSAICSMRSASARRHMADLALAWTGSSCKCSAVKHCGTWWPIRRCRMRANR